MASAPGAIHGPPSVLSRRHPCRRIRLSQPRNLPSPVHSRQHPGNGSGPRGKTRGGPSPHSRCPDPVESEATPPILPPFDADCAYTLLRVPHRNPPQPPEGARNHPLVSGWSEPGRHGVGANSAPDRGWRQLGFPCFTLTLNAETPRAFPRRFLSVPGTKRHAGTR